MRGACGCPSLLHCAAAAGVRSSGTLPVHVRSGCKGAETWWRRASRRTPLAALTASTACTARCRGHSCGSHQSGGGAVRCGHGAGTLEAGRPRRAAHAYAMCSEKRVALCGGDRGAVDSMRVATGLAPRRAGVPGLPPSHCGEGVAQLRLCVIAARWTMHACMHSVKIEMHWRDSRTIAGAVTHCLAAQVFSIACGAACAVKSLCPLPTRACRYPMIMFQALWWSSARRQPVPM